MPTPSIGTSPPIWSATRPAIARRSGGEPTSTSPIASANSPAQCLARGQNLHHPHYVGHQVPAVRAARRAVRSGRQRHEPGDGDLTKWARSPRPSNTRSSPRSASNSASRAGTFTGLVTSGGSLANLTALLTARNVALGDAWTAGLTGRRPAPVIVAHADIHYSVTRSAGILGLGTDHIHRAELDSHRRMDANRLDEQLANCVREACRSSRSLRRVCDADRCVRSARRHRRSLPPARSLAPRRRRPRRGGRVQREASPSGRRPRRGGQRHLRRPQDAVRPGARRDGLLPRPRPPLRRVSPRCAVSLRSHRPDARRLRQRPGDDRVHEAGRRVRTVGHLVALRAAALRRHGRRHVRPRPAVARHARRGRRLRDAPRAGVQHRRLPLPAAAAPRRARTSESTCSNCSFAAR